MEENFSRKSVLNIVSSIAISFFGFVSLIVIKQYMGIEVIGIIAFSLAYVSLFGIIGDMGYSHTHVKKVSEGKNIGKCHGIFLSIKLFLTTIMGLVILLCIAIQKYIFDIEFESSTVEIVIYFTLIQHLIANLNLGFRTIFTSKLEVAKSKIPRVLGRFLIMCMKLFIAITGLHITYLVGAEIIGLLVILALYLYLFSKQIISKPDYNYLKLYTRFAIPVLLTTASLIVIQRFDKVMLGFFFSSVDVGYYYLPQRITEFLLFFMIGITNLMYPKISALYSKGDKKGIRNLTSKVELHGALIFVPLILPLFILAEPIMTIVFGPDTIVSVPILQILLLATLLNILRTPYSVQIIGTGHPKSAMKVMLCALIINIVLNLLLIPNELLGYKLLGWGIYGAAISTLVTILFQGVIGKYLAYIYTGSKTNYNVIKIILTTIILGSVIFSLLDGYSLNRIYIAPLFFTITIICLFCFYLIGELTSREIKFYAEVLNPFKMLKYLKTELYK